MNFKFNIHTWAFPKKYINIIKKYNLSIYKYKIIIG